MSKNTTLTSSFLTNFPQKLLNQEEVSFIMRQKLAFNTNSVLNQKITEQKDFKLFFEDISKKFSSSLSQTLRCPVTTSFSLADKQNFRSDDICFKAENILYRIAEDDAISLVSLALRCKNHHYKTKIKGISLNILKQCLTSISKILHQNAPQDFTTATLTKIDVSASTFIKPNALLLLTIDVNGQIIKLYLVFSSKQLQNILFQKKCTNTDFSDKHYIIHDLEQKKIKVKALTSPIHLPLAQILQWKKGSFIPLGLKPDEEIILQTKGTAPLKAVIGQKNTHIAVKLTTEVNKE